MATGTQLEKSVPALPGQPRFADRLAGLWGSWRIRWVQMPPAQRNWTITSVLLLIALSGGLLWYAMRTDWRTLYAGLDPSDAVQIGQILTQAQIPFDVSANGTGILVPAPQLDKARLATAAKGGVKSGRLGFEIFDKPNWVGSEFDEQVNYQRALEGELEHTVGTLSDVESARVHLVLPRDSLFRDQDRPAKAAVVIKLRYRSLADGEPDAIRNLVASAVDGLTPDHVVLVDAAGHLPLGPKTAEAMQTSAEQALEEKLISTLEPVTGAGNVRTSVTLDYALDAANRTKLRPSAGGCRSSRHRIERTQLPGAARLSETDNARRDRKDRVWNLRSLEDREAHGGRSGADPAHDSGHCGQRQANPAGGERQGSGLAATLGRRTAQPERAGPGGGGLRRDAGRSAHGGRFAL